MRVPLAPMQLSGESIAFNIWRDSEDVTEKRVELRERAEAALAERFDWGEAGPELDEAQRRYRERFMEDFEESHEYADAKTHYIEEHLEEWIAELRDELSVV